MWPFRAKPSEEQRAIQAWPWDVGPVVGGPADRTISPERALHLVPVFAAARLLADSVASLTPKLYTTGSNGIPLLQPTPALFVQPSVHGTLFDWLHRLVTSMALQGDGIGLITNRNYYGFPTMVEWLDPAHVMTDEGTTIAGAGSYMNPIWFWHGRRINPDDIIHIPWMCMPHRVRGLSPIGAYRMTANVGLGAEEYAANWFGNGGVPPGTFKNNMQKVSKEDADAITARVTDRMRQRKPLVFGVDWDYTPIAIKPHEAQFVATMQLTATQVAVIYGIPPEKIGGTTGHSLTYSTVESNTLDYLTFSLRPWLVRVEAALSNLFARGTFVKFDTTDMLRTDSKTKAEIDVLSLGWNPPAYRTVDEVRADRDLPPLPKPPPQPAPALPPAAPPNGTTPPPPANGKQPAARPVA